jgi:hypothetical protein
MADIDWDSSRRRAQLAALDAYPRYSGFPVDAAVLTATGHVYGMSTAAVFDVRRELRGVRAAAPDRCSEVTRAPDRPPRLQRSPSGGLMPATRSLPTRDPVSSSAGMINSDCPPYGLTTAPKASSPTEARRARWLLERYETRSPVMDQAYARSARCWRPGRIRPSCGYAGRDGYVAWSRGRSRRVRS